MQPTPAPNSQVIPPLPLKCSRLNRYNHPFDALQATVDYSVDRVVAALSQPYPATSRIRQNKSRRPYSSARQVLQCFELIDHPESTPSSRSRQKARELVPLTLRSFFRWPVRVGGSTLTTVPLTWLRCWCIVWLIASWRR